MEPNPDVFLNGLIQTFYPKFDEFWAEIDRVVAESALDDEDHGVYKSYCQRHLHPLMMAAPFCHRIFIKPLGYPGDFEMMRMIQEDEFDGPNLFSKLVNKYALNIPLAKAARNRNRLLAEQIKKFVESRAEPTVRILSLASGPALEIQQLIEQHPDIASRIHLTLLDQEAEALRYSQDSIYMKRIMHNSSIRVNLVHQSIGSFIRQLTYSKTSDSPFDMIYIFGLFDYFDDKICTYFLRNCLRLLKADGKILISNFSMDNHHHRTFMEYMFDWYIIFRTTEKLEALGRSVDVPCDIHVDEDDTSVIKLLHILLTERG